MDYQNFITNNDIKKKLLYFFSENKNESLIQKEKLNIGLIQKYKK